MEKLKIYFDRKGNTLTVWFADPKGEYVGEEADDEIVLMKSKDGGVIGFEKLNFLASSPQPMRVAFETAEV